MKLLNGAVHGDWKARTESWSLIALNEMPRNTVWDLIGKNKNDSNLIKSGHVDREVKEDEEA